MVQVEDGNEQKVVCVFVCQGRRVWVGMVVVVEDGDGDRGGWRGV